VLFQKLFPPDAREAIARANRVLISPDGVLWDLPFAALVVNDGGEPRYLGLDKRLAYSQSLTAFAQVSAPAAVAPSVARPRVLVVGNPLYENARRNDANATDSGPGGGVANRLPQRATGELALLSRDAEIPAPLPHAQEEARRVATMYGARAAVGAEPTEAWFRERAGTADIIHLATHGYFSAFRAVASGVRLAVPEREPLPSQTDNDGALQAWEVFSQLQLRADLVVLSACETGVGAKVAGEGLVGLTRAFQIAGAASVVATQWKVADQSTASAMVAFHQQLQRGADKDEALRQAIRGLAADPKTRDPYYWAPFMLIGDVRPLRGTARR
jgi:CHAT domain-containing protein